MSSLTTRFGGGAPILLALSIAALLAGVVSACAARNDEEIVVLPSPPQDLLLWTIDAQGGRDTYWIRANRQGGRVLASRPGIVFAVPGGLYEIEEREVALPTCDCDAWEAAEGKGPCPARVDGGLARTLVAVRRPDGEEIPIAEAPAAEGADGPAFGELESAAAVFASMGPYLFVRTDTRTLACGADRGDATADFSVFDIVAGRTVELLSDAEREAVLGREQAAAFELFAGDTLADAAHPEDLELTAMTPVIVPGAGIGLRYQFTARSSFAAADGTWSAYTRSVDVPAAVLPAAVAPFAAIPDALHSFPLPGEGLAIGGFAPVTATRADLAALELLFAAAPEEGNGEAP